MLAWRRTSKTCCTRSLTRGSSRTSSRPGPPNSLQMEKPTLLSVRMWGPRAVTRPPQRSWSSSAAFLL